MPSTNEMLQTELGKAFIEAKQRAERINMSYRKNAIGEDVVVEYNPYTLSKKYPYAEVIANAYDKMIEKVIPKDAILSSSFQSWINREKNELMVNSKINRDEYFKEQVNFETGEAILNRGNDLLQAKINFLQKSLSTLEKAFTTHMRNNADKAFADEETLKKYETHYVEQAEKVKQMLESGDFSYYDKKDEEGNVIKAGMQEDAQKHINNIDNLLDKVNKAQNKYQNSEETSNVSVSEDFVGDNLSKIRKVKN